ncbi:cyclophane-forming radical SAM/SPASM peptide maturase YhhB [Sphingomonas bacterium]|uniref:cyclophane-forming radical SAM/SPASM peptide maturase YhhB n=1 Tax=Sphingomonas bacterium TaxID=1895847 RepID=UPI0015763B2C|nr:cyclophane-forming radical SAM/SPASM peptide maturase YhhB [Sphingomonas bacterium]
MIRIDTVLVKLASRCNLNCDYCYVYQMGDDAWRLQPKRMANATVDVLSSQLARLVAAQAAPLSVVFHGGEPLLIGAERFERACRTLREALGPASGLHLQTNALLLSDEVIAICAKHDVGISISFDGPAEVHDAHRPDHAGRGSHDRVATAVRRVLAHPAGRELLTGLLAVIDLAAEPAAVYEHLKALGAPSIDVLYRDGNHDALPPGKASHASTEYGDWMVRMLDHYLADPTPIRVRVLDDMLRLAMGGASRKEGVGTAEYGILVVDTDGGLAKNDTLKSARAGDRFARPTSILRDDVVAFASSPEFAAYHAAQRPSASACLSCPELAVCGGGMPTHRWSAAGGLANPSVFCADQKTLIAAMRRRVGLAKVA